MGRFTPPSDPQVLSDILDRLPDQVQTALPGIGAEAMAVRIVPTGQVPASDCVGVVLPTDVNSPVRLKFDMIQVDPSPGGDRLPVGIMPEGVVSDAIVNLANSIGPNPTSRAQAVSIATDHLPIVDLPRIRVSPFGPVRATNVWTHADLINPYGIDSFDWEVTTASGGTVTHLPNESAILLSVTGASGSTARLRSREAYRYQAGKALRPLFTVSHSDLGQVNQVRRWGYFDDNDGYFFQVSDTDLSIVRRTSTSGSPVETVIAQGDWNIDTLGSLDITGLSIYELAWAWLGAGGVTIFINHVPVHDDDRAGADPRPFTRTAQLPLTFEIVNTGASVAASMRHVCASVMSDGGAEPPRFGYAYEMPAEVTIGSTETPLFTIRAATTFNAITNRRVIMPTFLQGSSEQFRGSFGLIWNASLTGATFAVTPDAASSAEIDTAATAFSGGTRLGRMFVPANEGRERSLQALFAINARRLRGGSGHTVTITGRSEQAATSADMRAVLEYVEVS